MADHTTAAGPVDYVDWLTQILFEQRADDPCRCIGAAACTPGNDQGDRALGIRGVRRAERKRQHPGDGKQDSASNHGISSNAIGERLVIACAFWARTRRSLAL